MVPLRFRVAHAMVEDVAKAIEGSPCRTVSAGDYAVELEVDVETHEWEAVAHRVQAIGGITLSVGHQPENGGE